MGVGDAVLGGRARVGPGLGFGVYIRYLGGLTAGLSGVKQRQRQTRFIVGAGLPAMVFNDDAGDPDKTRRSHVFRRQAGSYKGPRIHDAKRVALDLDLRRPSNTLAHRA
jgi:hypothetical protein